MFTPMAMCTTKYLRTASVTQNEPLGLWDLQQEGQEAELENEAQV